MRELSTLTNTNMTGFVSCTPILVQQRRVGDKLTKQRQITAHRRIATTAVLNEPSANPYLKKVSGDIARDFLTRRAIHTVIYYYREMRDSASTNWLLNFENFEMKEKNDMFEDGEAFLVRMKITPEVKGEYVQRHPRAYLTKRYPFTIRPSHVCDSILASRKQIAAEWAKDLSCVSAENLEIKRISMEKLLEKDERVLNSRRNPIFDIGDFDQSPLRRLNLRKLLVLITQHAVMRYLVYLRDCSNHDYMFLYNFTTRFGPINNGNSYLENLFDLPPVLRSNPKHTVYPKDLAVEILRLREVIANEWISIMEQIPKEQHALSIEMLKKSTNLDFPFGTSGANSGNV